MKSKSEDGNTPLILAIIEKNMEMALDLINKGADIEVTGEDGRTPLSLAMYRGGEKLVECLLSKGANIHAQDNENCTTLMLAIIHGQTEIAKYLINEGVNIETQTKFGFTPLKWAVNCDNTEIVKLLVSAGALLETGDINLTSEMQKIIDTASVVDSLFIERSIINQEIENIDLDILLSRFKYNLSTKGYVKSFQTHIDDLNQCCPSSSKEKNELIKSIRQDQEDFNMECASIFKTILGINASMPIAMIIELLKEVGAKEIPEEAQKIIDFYDKYGFSDTGYFEKYLQNDNPSLKEVDEFLNEVTEANIEIFEEKLAYILEQCNSNNLYATMMINFCVMALPYELLESIDQHCQLMGSHCLPEEIIEISG